MNHMVFFSQECYKLAQKNPTKTNSTSKIPADFLGIHCVTTISVETATFGQHDEIQKNRCVPKFSALCASRVLNHCASKSSSSNSSLVPG